MTRCNGQKPLVKLAIRILLGPHFFLGARVHGETEVAPISQIINTVRLLNHHRTGITPLN